MSGLEEFYGILRFANDKFQRGYLVYCYACQQENLHSAHLKHLFLRFICSRIKFREETSKPAVFRYICCANGCLYCACQQENLHNAHLKHLFLRYICSRIKFREETSKPAVFRYICCANGCLYCACQQENLHNAHLKHLFLRFYGILFSCAFFRIKERRSLYCCVT